MTMDYSSGSGAKPEFDPARYPDVVIVKAEQVKGREAFPNLHRRVLAFNEKLMLVEHVMEKGSVFPRHSHFQEQLAYLISGHIRVQIEDEEPFEARAGDSFVVRGGADHQVVAIEHSVALDVFTPVRDDFIEWVDRV